MLKNLNNIYVEFDLYKIVNATLHDFNFNIKKKIFDEFLIKYITIIALL